MENINGYFLIKKSGKWVEPFTLMLCGTISGCSPLVPNTNTCTEPAGIMSKDESFIKEKGLYKYVVQFAPVEYQFGRYTDEVNKAIP